MTEPEPFRPLSADSIPMARPVTGPFISKVPAHEFLLLDESGKAVWADIGCAALLVLAFEVVAGLTLGVVADVALGAQGAPPDAADSELKRLLLFPGIAIRGLGVIMITALIVRHRRQTARAVGVSSSGWMLNTLIGAGATVVVYVLIAIVMLLVWVFWPELHADMTENTERLLALVPRLRLVHFVPVSIMVGLYEELFFRGFLMGRLRRATGSWTIAVISSTIVFTAGHALDQTVGAMIVVAVLSLVFSVVTIWRRSIIPAVVAHALFDFSQFWLLTSTAGPSWT